MQRLSSLLTAAVVASLVSPAFAHAGGTKTFSAATFEELDQGETEGAAVESSGRVTPGFVAQRQELTATTAFTCIGSRNTVLVGTSDEATIVEITPTKKALPRDDDESGIKTTTLAKLDGVVVSALTRLRNGDIIAATLPGGTLFRVRGKNVTEFAKLDVDQIWAIREHRDRILVATGPRGELWSLSSKGDDAKIILDVDERDLLSLELVGPAVFVGTSPSARIYRVLDDEVKGALVHEFTGSEVRALAVTARGSMFAAVNAFDDRGVSGVKAVTQQLNRASLTNDTPIGSLDVSQTPLRSNASLHHVDLGRQHDPNRANEAAWEAWLTRTDQYFTAILADDRDSVLVASSAGGKVYRVSHPREAATIADLDERQAAGLCRTETGDATFAIAAHGAAAYQLRVGPATTPRYRSRVFTADQPSRFGSLLLRGQGSLRVRARTGPTKEPGSQWTDWRPVAVEADAGGFRGTLAGLAKHRHLQIEVTLASSDAELRSMTAFYAPENLPPMLTQVDVAHPRFKANDAEEVSHDLTISWKADARDDDELIYDVRIRPEGSDDSQWIPINRDEPLSQHEYKLDLDTVPDGIYEVEIRASDAPSNGSFAALTDELVSAPFVIDRQRPQVSDPRVQGRQLLAQVHDIGGYVHDVAYSIDGGSFHFASAQDGLFDSSTETVVIAIPDELTPGNHRLLIRARDSFGNLGALAMTLKR